MPIYAYACAACGLRKDILQKLSEAVITTCPDCGKEAFSKQLTAPAFQLKGSGWYVTDFREGAKKPESGAGEAATPGAPTSATPAVVPASAGGAATPSVAPATPSATPATSATAPVTAVKPPASSGSSDA